MKKCFKYLMTVAALAMSFVSCQKEIDKIEEKVPEGEFVYTFALDNAVTKAFLDIDDNGTYTKWEDGDLLGVYTKDSENKVSYNAQGRLNVTTDPVTFNIYSYNALHEGDMVYCYFPYTTNNSKDATSVALSIPTEQNGKMNAMPMVAIPFGVEKDVDIKTNTPVGTIYMQNLAGVFQVRIFSTVADYRTETVKSVSFTSESNIAGSFTLDITQNNDLTISNYAEKTITVKQDATVGSDKNDGGVVNMVVAPGSYTGTLIVTTDVASYAYDISTAKSVERNHIKPLNVNLANGERTATLYFTEVTSPKDDYSGTYLIVHEFESSYVAYEGKSAADGSSVLSVNKKDGKILATDELVAESLTISNEEGTYYAQNSDGKYLYMSATTSSVGVTEEKTAVSITFDSMMELKSTTGTVGTSLRAKDHNKIKFYTGSSNPLVHYYVLDGTDVKNDPNRVTLAVSDVEVASNTKNVTVSVNCNSTWHAVATSDYLTGGSLDITGESTADSFIVPFKEINSNVHEAKVVEVKVSAGEGSYHIEKTITITQKAPIAKLSVNPESQVVAADATGADFTVPSSGVNFDWSIISITVDDAEPSGDYSVTLDDDGETVHVSFPSNDVVNQNTNEKVIIVTVGDNTIKTASATIKQAGKNNSTVKVDKTFTISSDAVVTSSGYNSYVTTVDKREWAISFGGNNLSIGTNKTQSNRDKCNLSGASYQKYAISGVATNADVASVFACNTSLSDVKKISYSFNGGSGQQDTVVYLLYSADGNTYSLVSLSSGNQGASISSDTQFEFSKCSGYFAVLFKSTNDSGAWRIDNVELTFTYEE